MMNRPIRDWRGQRVWLVGASSGIGEALAKQLLKRGAVVALSARRKAPLESLLQDQKNRDHVVAEMDATVHEQVLAAHSKILAKWPHIDVMIWLAGTYQAMRADEIDINIIQDTINANLTSAYNGLDVALPSMLKQKSGAIALVSSVAGFRGLPKALVYGPTKAAMINLAEVLYNDLKPHGISVFLINPGFVETPLTAQNDFKMPALITSDQAALEILKGFAMGQFEMHFPKRFTGILKLLRLLPYRLYFALIKKLV